MSPLEDDSRGPAIPVAAAKKSPYDMIQEAIFSGAFAPNQALVETALAEWCQVSRTPVREALMRLEQDGVITRHGRELVVRERSPEEILDIYETRIVLEGTAARVACARRTVLDLVHLRRKAEYLVTMTSGDAIEMARENREFHRALWRATHNESLVDLLTRLDRHLSRYPATTLSVPGRWDEANLEHVDLVDAVEQQDAQRASEIAAAHFTRARDIRLRLWSESTV